MLTQIHLCKLSKRCHCQFNDCGWNGHKKLFCYQTTMTKIPQNRFESEILKSSFWLPNNHTFPSNENMTTFRHCKVKPHVFNAIIPVSNLCRGNISLRALNLTDRHWQIARTRYNSRNDMYISAEFWKIVYFTNKDLNDIYTLSEDPIC